ncbi:MAG: hypothetical protein AB7O97_12520 [Planctomycetota bacterium]
MLQRSLGLALFAGSVLAQSNAVPGLDIRMYDLVDISYNGRRGAAFPNGEAGFSIGHSWCNTGTVDLPWQSQAGGVMVDQYPRIAFLLARESGGRLVQVSGRSFAKHSPTAFNFSSGPCAPCTAAGGSFFYVGCSDTYGSGINSNQASLGPTDEIDPWLGTWDPRGSYFDRGDPPVAGAAAVDSVKSLTFSQVSAFDAVKNRITVQEADLLPGASYFAQVYACVQGEAVGVRDNNAVTRPVSISGGSGSWNASASGASVVGPLVSQWPGATSHVGGNGNDDGRFAVAVKVTGPVGGMYRYEYAIQNLDNNRGGASFRIPVLATAVVQNAGFSDIDGDPLNDWTFARTPTEISFSAQGTNSLDWNTIYNCWFDCDVPPGAGTMRIDQARPGAGATTVQVQADAPSGLSYAQMASIGTSCGTCQGTFYELFPLGSQFDLAGRSMTLTPAGAAYTVTDSAVAFVPAAGTNLGLGLTTPAQVTLPFALSFPGGSTTSLQVAPSGYVTTQTGSVQVLPTAAALLQGGPRWAAGWTVLQPQATGASNVWYDATPSRAIVTWNAMNVVGGSSPSTFQLQFFPNGVVHVVWQTVGASNFAVMTGWSPGTDNLDPGNTDLSTALPAGPIALCGPSFDGLQLAADAEPVLGTTVQWLIDGMPTGTTGGILFRSVQLATPPIDLTPIGMPGCFQYPVAPWTEFFAVSGSSAQLSQFIPNVIPFVGVELVGQAVIYQPPLTPLGFVASNGFVLTLGL